MDNLRERILDAAIVEFLEKGFAKSSLRNISKSLGVTTGAIYSNFENKEDLLRETVTHTRVKFDKICRDNLKHLPEDYKISDYIDLIWLKVLFQNKAMFDELCELIMLSPRSMKFLENRHSNFEFLEKKFVDKRMNLSIILKMLDSVKLDYVISGDVEVFKEDLKCIIDISETIMELEL